MNKDWAFSEKNMPPPGVLRISIKILGDRVKVIGGPGGTPKFEQGQFPGGIPVNGKY